MEEKCPLCGHPINKHTLDCQGCDYRVREERLSTAEDAIEGWRKEVDRLKIVIEDLRRV